MTDARTFYDQRAPFRLQESRRAYPQLLQRYYSFFVPQGQRVMELGCGIGDLLAAMKPARGLGADISPAMIDLARQRHPELEFQAADAATVPGDEKFDYILMADLINDVPDVQKLLESAQRHSYQHTRLVLNFFNFFWRPILAGAEKLGAK